LHAGFRGVGGGGDGVGGLQDDGFHIGQETQPAMGVTFAWSRRP
jgi:hypothetical protein